MTYAIIYDGGKNHERRERERENIRKNDGLSELRAATLVKFGSRNMSTVMAVDCSECTRDYLRRPIDN